MIPRTCEHALKKIAASFPVVVITGPRQSGKTTLSRHFFNSLPYVSLENPDILERAINDPKGFLNNYKGGAIFDEIQRAPHLFSYLQQIIDENRKKTRFVLTGSQQFGLLSSISQSLAGRAGSIELLPFSACECYGGKIQEQDIDTLMFNGFYPPVHDRSIDPSMWYANYVRTYIERDVRQMVNIKDLVAFQRFLRLCAARTGCELNLSSMASDTGISHTTASSWISILQASYILFLLPPWHANIGKRLVKTPKLYFFDTGLACWLMSIESPRALNIHSHRGELFETFIISENIKQRFNEGKQTNLFFYKDKSKMEIDIIITEGNTIQPVEIKSSQTMNLSFLDSLHTFTENKKMTIRNPVLVYGGNESYTYKKTAVVSWHDYLKKL